MRRLEVAAALQQQGHESMLISTRRERLTTPANPRFLLAIAALFLLLWLVILLLWSAVRPYGDLNVTYYDELADAFLHGQLSLLRPPPPDMLALPDPYDPVANERYRMVPTNPGRRFQGVHDLTLYDGKFYVQWGPLPALVLIPLRWIAGHDLPMGRVVLIVAMLAALLYAISLVKLARLSGLSPPRLLIFMAILLVLLCPFWTYALGRVAVYETALFFSQFFMGAALLSVVTAFDARLTRGHEALLPLTLASFCLGCALNCRSELALVGLMVPVIGLAWLKASPLGWSWQRLLVLGLALGGPAALLLGANLTYNAARFGNILETGPSWILWGGHESILQHKYKLLSFGRVLPNIWYYFLAPLSFPPDLPIVAAPSRLRPHEWMSASRLADYYDYVEATSGLFVVEPIALLALATPVLFLKRLRDRTNGRLRCIVLLLLLAAASSALLFLSTATLRYGAEWCIWLIIAGVLIALHGRERLRRLDAPVLLLRAVDAGLVLSTAWSVWLGASFLLRGGG
jgi:hypothetical protein